MKNLVKNACVLASALMVGGASNASTVYPYYGPNSYEIEYEVDYFEPLHSNVDLGSAADGLSLLLQGAQLAFDKNAHPAVRTLGILGIWGGLEIGARGLGYGSPTKKIWEATGGKILKFIDKNHADVQIKSPTNGKEIKMRMRVFNGPSPMYFPVRYDQQPQEYGISQADYNYYLSQNFPTNNIPDNYGQMVTENPDLPTEEELMQAQSFNKSSGCETAPPAVVYPQF